MNPIKQWQPIAPDDPLYDRRLVVVLEPVGWSDIASEGYVVGAKDWHPLFQPDYLPHQMAKMGVFGDAYWGSPLGEQRRVMLPAEYTAPKSGVHYTNHRAKQAGAVNFHGRPASFPRDWWLDKGLIFSPDPLGWYEWYCWYSRGRRIKGYDAHQIRRWLSFVARTRKMLETTGHAGSAQALLHWASAPTERR